MAPAENTEEAVAAADGDGPGALNVAESACCGTGGRGVEKRPPD